MYRSFTDRIFGGVCGGLAALLSVNVWWLRAGFTLLTFVTTGAFALFYAALWIGLPQQSVLVRQRGGAGMFLLLLILAALVVVGWLAWWTTGTPLYWPLLLFLVCALFFLRQVRG